MNITHENKAARILKQDGSFYVLILTNTRKGINNPEAVVIKDRFFSTETGALRFANREIHK